MTLEEAYTIVADEAEKAFDVIDEHEGQGLDTALKMLEALHLREIQKALDKKVGDKCPDCSFERDYCRLLNEECHYNWGY